MIDLDMYECFDLYKLIARNLQTESILFSSPIAQLLSSWSVQATTPCLQSTASVLLEIQSRASQCESLPSAKHSIHAIWYLQPAKSCQQTRAGFVGQAHFLALAFAAFFGKFSVFALMKACAVRMAAFPSFTTVFSSLSVASWSLGNALRDPPLAVVPRSLVQVAKAESSFF